MKFSIKWKLLAVCMLLITAPTVILGIFNYQTFKTEAYDNTQDDLRLVARDWQITIEAYKEQLERFLRREEALVQQRLESISLDARRLVEYGYGNQKNDQDFTDTHWQSIFDKIAQIKIGRSGYVFVINEKGNYLVSKNRLYDSSNISKGLDNPGPFLSDLKQRSNRMDEDDVFATHYQWYDIDYGLPRTQMVVFSYFRPLNLFIGAASYYTDFKSYELERILQEEVKQKMAQQRMGENGYIWAIDSKGNYIVSKDRLRDGENIADAQDEKNVFFIKEIITAARKLKSGQTYLSYYMWKNIGEAKPQKKLAAFTYVPGWDWIVGVSAYQNDFLKGLSLIKGYIIRVCLISIIIGSLIAYLFALFISRPITKLESIALKVARGNVNVEVDPGILAKQDEIGSLARSFNAMVLTLRREFKELQQSEARLTAAYNQLKQTQAQLIQAEKMQVVGRLASGVAHEVKNPLGIVLQGIEHLEKTLPVSAPENKDLEIIKIIKNNIKRADNIIRSLVDFSRATNMNVKPESLEAIVKNALGLIQHRLKQEKIEVVVEFSQELPEVIVDKGKIEQVFVNLFLNSIQAMGEGGRIVIRIRSYDTIMDVFKIGVGRRGSDFFQLGEKAVVVEVEDTGSGISTENLKHIFDPFFTTKGLGGGTGLGLFVTKNIIDLHKGLIEVESILGQGTKVILTLKTQA